MKTAIIRLLATALAIVLILSPGVGSRAATPAPTTSSASSQVSVAPAGRNAVVIVLDGQIDEYRKAAIVHRFEQARRLGADTVILQIDTYGGLVTSGLEISRFLKRQDDLHVIALVHEKAISAGAMIALACDELVMEPGSMIGDCAPISIGATGGLETMGAAERAKMESPILADFYDSAARNHHDPTLVTAMVSVGRVVHWIQDPQGERKFVDQSDFQALSDQGWKPVGEYKDPVDSGETLLTLNADEAVKLGLAGSIESSADVLARARGLTIQDTFAPGAGEELVALLGSTAVRALLTTIFLAALYTSLSHPGHGMAEVTAVVALGVLVGVPLLTGYAQWWEILAIVLGVFLVALEVFVIPGFGVAGISGILLILIGLTMTWVGNEPSGIPGILPQLPGTWAALRRGALVVVSGMTAALFLWVWLSRNLPKLPYFSRLILTTTSGQVLSVDPRTADAGSVTGLRWPLVGAKGRVVTDLRPGGTAAFHDSTIGDARIADVVSDSGFVSAGREVVVREVQGNHIVVRAGT